jgi:tetraacyldisaccharide 4'-kinase
MKKNTVTRLSQITHSFLLSAFRLLLFPISIIFWIVATLRRKAYQHRWIRSETFAVPTICVGNLNMGGTGKTPHVEYLANFLSQKHQIAILSRGYGRKTKGYINATETPNLSSDMIGDEPMQYATKFPNVDVAVCEKRKTGIEKLLQKNPKLEVVILDDAYQHFAVNYAVKILLTEYHRPFFDDIQFPTGNLRECRKFSKYANLIIITKCPENLTNEEKALFLQKLKPKPNQEVFFTKIGYKEKAEGSKSFTVLPSCGHTILLITGIANPAPLVNYLATQYNEIYRLHFPDHHSFTKKDIEKIIRKKEKLGGENCTIMTTEKDAARLQAFDNMPDYQTIPIEIVFLENETVFKEKLLSLLKT